MYWNCPLTHRVVEKVEFLEMLRLLSYFCFNFVIKIFWLNLKFRIERGGKEMFFKAKLIHSKNHGANFKNFTVKFLSRYSRWSTIFYKPINLMYVKELTLLAHYFWMLFQAFYSVCTEQCRGLFGRAENYMNKRERSLAFYTILKGKCW